MTEPPSSESCCRCGGLASAALTRGGERISLCLTCLDRAEPALQLGSLLKAFRRPRRRDGACPYCAWTQEELERTTLCGCPLCYEALNVNLAVISAD